MRLPRLRFRLRWLLVLVAVAGVMFGVGAALRRRQRQFEQLTKEHAQGSLKYARAGSAYWHEDASCVEFQENQSLPSPGGYHMHPLAGLSTKHDNQWQSYHSAMARRYQRARQRPWLPVGADPAPPLGEDQPDFGRPKPIGRAPAPDTGP